MDRHLQELAAQVGLRMHPPERLVNSRLALATAEFARERGRFELVHQALFQLHWRGPGRLDDVGDLRRVAAEAGLDGDELEEALRAGRYEEIIDASRREAIEIGIEAVPAHVFGRRYLVIGAQPDEVYQSVLDRLESEAVQ